MNTIEIEIHKDLPKLQVPTFKGLPVLGNAKAIALIPTIKQVISCNWDGHAEIYFNVTSLETLDNSWFKSADKGGISLFGLVKGKVVMGIVLYEGYKGATNPLERKPHYYVKLTNCANPWD